MVDGIFREYDIRGIVGKELDLNEVENLTKALVSYFLKNSPDLSTIIVGMDGRTHSPIIKEKIIDTVTKLGINVIDIGLCPTPVFYFSLFNTKATSGFMVTASHNPGKYNGIKISLGKNNVWGKQIQEVKKIYHDIRDKKLDVIPIGEKGKIETYDAISSYVDWISEHFKHLIGSEVNAVFDCGNGTAGPTIEKLIEKMNFKNTKVLFSEVDGTFPNHEADPTKPENMKTVKQVLKDENLYAVGVGFDGDSDRMNPMTKSGYLVPGDKLLAIYSKNLTYEENHKIVFDIKSSHAPMEYLRNKGLTPILSPSGHSLIKENMKKSGAILAGELSCHFFFKDRYFGYDDAIYAALRLLEILNETQKSLDELLEDIPFMINSPEYRIDCDEDKKVEITNHVKENLGNQKDFDLITIDGVRAQSSYGWGLIRPSNTQPAICLRFESNTQEGLNKIKENFINLLTPYICKETLMEHFEN